MKYIKKVSASYQGDSPIATSITSSSTNDEVAGAKAVFEIINSPSICQITNSARISCSVSSAWQNYKVPLNVQSISSDDYTFSTQNNDITVGNAPRLVEISFNCAIDTLPVANYNFRVLLNRNGSISTYAPTAFKTISGIDVGNLSNTTIIEVQEGDKIYLGYTANSSVSFYLAVNAILTIKTISYNTNSQTTLRKANILSNISEKETEKTKEAEPTETKTIEQPLEKEEVTDKDVGEIEAEKTTLQNEGSGDSK